MNPNPASPWPARWQRFSAASLRGYHAYGSWLVGITWRRFIVLSVLLMIVSGLLQNIPPFSWHWTRTVTLAPELPKLPEIPKIGAPEAPKPPAAPAASASKVRPGIHIEKPPKGSKTDGVEITIDDHGVRIVPKTRAVAASQAQAAASAAGQAPGGTAPLVDIRLPPGATGEAVRQAVEDARDAIEEAVRDAREDARDELEAARAEAQAAREAGRQATLDAARAIADARRAMPKRETHEVSLGEFLPSLAMLWIVGSVILKITYRQQIRAEATAAQAVETAEAESLKRQVVEARMAAMQAQIEPHFLFNTLASIDHLIEVDPQRASQMQKNLIALLRASMPTMRETAGSEGGTPRDLGRELAVIRPYLEILKVRMEERLTTTIDVPEGLLSAEFPAMMVQTLVENAIKHGLEPKPEGGHLAVKAEILHGKLAISVADTGLGFGRAATAGTGVGLANIRERLQLLYGTKAALTIAENPGGGTRVTITVPYKPVEGAGA
ncbi:sensor histidine kinase [Aquabacterium sp. OR-4]|uniref:sensor histidine kinase n=1 Tax=Aquabacterium sp. OR-4 TaxID=2978127 RepID=UPI0021B1C87B|nr:sensor histidine kinase [Aquabacterium sp. OR-4]MDT7837746.1 sensor histidine kinase [Aquabacterium sp. OR-4]